jgi:hypothetical protein
MGSPAAAGLPPVGAVRTVPVTEGEPDEPAAGGLTAGMERRSDRLLTREKELTRALDALAAERRRLPITLCWRTSSWTSVRTPTARGVRHDRQCRSAGHLNARYTTVVVVSDMPWEQIEAY